MNAELIAFLSWYLAALAAGWLALPLAFRLFRNLPDRGYAFSKPLGLLATAYLFWLLGSLGFVRNDVGGILLAAALVAGSGAAWLRREGFLDLKAWIAEQRPAVLAVEALFLLAFAGWAWLRAYSPNIDGTEKPMEFMFINSVLRSPTFPPHDAWLSGHAISYYYFGYVIVAALARLTGAASSMAFNLGIALLFALAAVASLGVVMNLVSLARRGRALLDAFWPALLAPLLVLLAGNYYGPLELAHNNGLLREAQVPAVWYDFGRVNPDIEQPGSLGDFERPPGVRAGAVNLWEWLDLKRIDHPPAPRGGSFNWTLGNWFFAARVIHDRNLVGVETEAITENPAFSFLLADMHPHVLALPFVVLATGLALEWLLWARRGAGGGPTFGWRSTAGLTGPRGRARLPSLPRLLLSAVILGGLAFLNTWDFPIYLFLVVTALALGAASNLGWEGMLRNLRYLALAAGALALLSIILYLPFYLTLQSQAGGLLPNLIYPSRFQQTVVMFGPVMAGVALFLVWGALRWREAFDRRLAWWAGGGLLAALVLSAGALTLAASLSPALSSQVDGLVYPLTRQEAFNLLWQRRLVDSLASLFPAALIGLTVGLGAGALRCTHPRAAVTVGVQDPPEAAETPLSPESTRAASPPVLMALAMILTGALLLLGPEYVYLRDQFGTRMNTLFKFYFQTWTLWAMAGAFGIWYVGRHARGWPGRLGVALALLAVLPGLVYLPGSLLATTRGFAGPPTLDGMAYFREVFPDDWAAIQWLNENVEGTPVIVEGTRGSYWVEGRSSRISMASGLPTLMGWINHEMQWRGPYYAHVAQRPEHIALVYQERDWGLTRSILDSYGVEYIVVSPLERSWYAPLYMPKFEIFMEKVFESGDTAVYRYQSPE